MIKKITCYILNKWWISLLFVLLSILLFGISETIRNTFFSNFCFGLSLLCMLILFISSCKQLIDKHWINGLFNLGILVIAFFLFAIIAERFITLDRFADNLIIPQNIEINKPINLESDGSIRPDSILNLKKCKIDFSLYNSFQPGEYQFDFWVGKLEKGKVFLKAFEITTNTELSKPYLKQKSSINIYNQSDSLIRICSKNDFTIYEGDWGKPYAARFEVWYKKENSQEIKMLFTKNYIIEGWMR